MYERLLSNGDITLFSPHDVPDLYDAYFGDADKFKELYESYERKTSIKKKTIPAMDLFSALIKERAETGRIYIMNVDHCNTHSSFKDTVYMSNLCQEITLPTKPLEHIDDEKGEIALCILSAINVGILRELDDLEELCELAVRALEEIIDYQRYPIKAAEVSTKARRSLGVGYIGLAHYLAKNKAKYNDKEAWVLTHKLSEAFQYYLLKASNVLAQERGACEYFNRTKYSEGIMPIDTYKKEVDDIVKEKLYYDWNGLRKSIRNTVSGTARCPHRCHRRAVPLCRTLPMESNHLEDSCPLRKVKKGLLSRLCHNIKALSNITPCCGTCLATKVTSIL